MTEQGATVWPAVDEVPSSNGQEYCTFGEITAFLYSQRLIAGLSLIDTTRLQNVVMVYADPDGARALLAIVVTHTDTVWIRWADVPHRNRDHRASGAVRRIHSCFPYDVTDARRLVLCAAR